MRKQELQEEAKKTKEEQDRKKRLARQRERQADQQPGERTRESSYAEVERQAEQQPGERTRESPYAEEERQRCAVEQLNLVSSELAGVFQNGAEIRLQAIWDASRDSVYKGEGGKIYFLNAKWARDEFASGDAPDAYLEAPDARQYHFW